LATLKYKRRVNHLIEATLLAPWEMGTVWTKTLTWFLSWMRNYRTSMTLELRLTQWINRTFTTLPQFSSLSTQRSQWTRTSKTWMSLSLTWNKQVSTRCQLLQLISISKYKGTRHPYSKIKQAHLSANVGKTRWHLIRSHILSTVTDHRAKRGL
jgi:hypothetical protein